MPIKLAAISVADRRVWNFIEKNLFKVWNFIEKNWFKVWNFIEKNLFKVWNFIEKNLFKVWNFRCACRMLNEGNGTGNAQLYCVDRDSSYMFRPKHLAAVTITALTRRLSFITYKNSTCFDSRLSNIYRVFHDFRA